MDGARVFREAWITAVKTHHPGEPEASFVAPWAETPEWEREAAGAVYEQIVQFVTVSDGATLWLTKEEKSRFVDIAWTAQLYKYFGAPEPADVLDYDDLPPWQREMYTDIFEVIEH
ncbi:hypothetical protein [Streptomyces venezuelae]|uniref:Uncharacterized protein n=1 Tax=Streptomyces venezuelae TaxID=54571 RepID=A0A5P2BPS0_STRVZ|nr:hypothetical protein [Streptomyces venezuelae]QES32472.1 hypothetical protein DEJ48_02795 [Streptomyces venezuelae]